MPSATYEQVQGELHRHGTLRHAHPHAGPHEHYAHHRHEHPRDDRGEHAHGHSHGLVDEGIKRSREGVRAVALALGVLAGTAVVQAFVFALSGSLALLADLIHNGGDSLTAIPLGIAFALRSQRAERLAGLAVVAAIFVSACVTAYEAVLRLIHPSTPGNLLALALAGAIGFAGNWLAALVRGRAGYRLDSPALIADGDHGRADAYVSLAVIASALAIVAGAPILDPLIGLGMTVVILRITRESWRTVREHSHP
jgi:cation diffusion facilitator family transporter